MSKIGNQVRSMLERDIVDIENFLKFLQQLGKSQNQKALSEVKQVLP